MADERLAGENHPSAQDPAALARQYSGAAVQHPGSPLAAPAMGAQFADTTNMTPAEATAEHGRLMRDPAFMSRLSGNRKGLDHLERLSEIRFGKPGDAAKKPAHVPGAPRYELDAGLAPEERAAATALAEREVALADAGDEGQREMDAMHAPKSTSEYSNLHHGAGRQVLLDAGVSPIATNFLITQAASYATLDDAAFETAQDKAVDFIARQPGGAKVLADAKAFLDGLKDNSPLLAAAVMASAYVPGIAELARLHRRGTRAAH